MHIHYTDGVFGSSTDRNLDPYALLMRDRRWILVAWCHWAKEIRTFSLHRISSAETTDDEFTMPEDKVASYLAAGFGGYPASGPSRLVRLRIPADAPPYVKEKCWAEDEQRSETGGDLEIEFRTAAIWAVERDVLAEGGVVEILEPADARENVRRAGEQMMRRHQSKV